MAVDLEGNRRAVAGVAPYRRALASGSGRLFAMGRGALLHGLQLLGCGPGDSLLLPEYICRDASDPLLDAGYEVRYYGVDQGLRIDLSSLDALIDSSTRAALVVDYFGFPQTLDGIARFCRDRGLYLIEDNAHGFLSADRGAPLGFRGDIGIVSIRKTLSLRDGAILLVNSAELRKRGPMDPGIPRVSWGSAFRWGLAIAGKVVARRLPRALPTLQRGAQLLGSTGSRLPPPSAIPVPPDAKATASLGPISGESWFEIAHTDAMKIILRRRANYLRLLDWLQGDRRVHIIFPELVEGICPYVFPILVDDGSRTIEEFRRRGIAADYWPDLPPSVSVSPDLYPSAAALRSRLVTLPVGQDVRVRARAEEKGSRGPRNLAERLSIAYRP